MDEKLIGTYRARGAIETVWKFYPKGVVTTSQPEGTTSGTYEWLDDKNLAIRLESITKETFVMPVKRIDKKGIYIEEENAEQPYLLRQKE